MKKLFSGVTRWVLVTLVVMMLAAGGVYAYKALTATGTATVEECLTFVGASSFELTLKPGEKEIAQLVIANSSTASMDVDLTSTVIPDPTSGNITVTIPKKITAPAEGQVTVDIEVAASKSAVPQAYAITIDFDR